MLFARGEMAVGVFWLVILVSVVAGLAIWLAPLGVALYRNHPSVAPIAIVTILLGWTLVGWACAMAWAVSPIERRKRVVYEEASEEEESPKPRKRKPASGNPFDFGQ